MASNKIIGLGLLIGGMGLAFWGYQMSGTLGSQLSGVFAGGTPDEVMYRYTGGGILAAVGIFLVMKN